MSDYPPLLRFSDALTDTADEGTLVLVSGVPALVVRVTVVGDDYLEMRGRPSGVRDDAEGVYLVPLSSVVYFSPKEGT